jgi:hypothetical protein
MRRDTIERVTRQEETVIDGSLTYCNTNVTVRYFGSYRPSTVHRTECARQWAYQDVSNSLGQRYYGADGAANCFVVDDNPF